jgi:hypothetical protein
MEKAVDVYCLYHRTHRMALSKRTEAIDDQKFRPNSIAPQNCGAMRKLSYCSMIFISILLTEYGAGTFRLRVMLDMLGPELAVFFLFIARTRHFIAHSRSPLQLFSIVFVENPYGM